MGIEGGGFHERSDRTGNVFSLRIYTWAFVSVDTCIAST